MQYLLIIAIIFALISVYFSCYSIRKDIQNLQKEEAEEQKLTLIGKLLAEEAQLYLANKRSPHQILLERRFDESRSNN